MSPDFKNSKDLSGLVEAYFLHIEGAYHLEDVTVAGDNEEDTISRKIWDREPEPATFSELAYFLGFNSRKEFKEYEQHGSFAGELNRARLRVEMAYEKKLHNKSSTGAIFALKSMGWNEKARDITNAGESLNTLNIVVTESGPRPAGNEQDVVL